MTADPPDGPGPVDSPVPDAAAELRRLAALPLEERAAALATTVRRLEAALEATDAGAART